MNAADYKGRAAQTETARYIGTSTVYPGMALCRRDDYTNPSTALTQEEIAYEVEVPSLTNSWRPAGVIARGVPARTSESNVRMISYDYISRATEVYTDQSIAKGDPMGIHAGTGYVRKGGCGGPIIGRALETVVGTSAAPKMVKIDMGAGLDIRASDLAKVVDFTDEFNGFADGIGWDLTQDGSGIVGTAGELVVATGATAQNEAYVESNAVIDFTSPWYFRVEAALTAGANNDSAYIIGVSDDTGADIITDTTGAIQTAGDHAIFYKLHNVATIRSESQTGTSADQWDGTGTGAADADGSYDVFEGIYDGTTVTLYINSTAVHTVTDTDDHPTGSGRLVIGAKTLASQIAQLDVKSAVLQGIPA